MASLCFTRCRSGTILDSVLKRLQSPGLFVQGLELAFIVRFSSLLLNHVAYSPLLALLPILRSIDLSYDVVRQTLHATRASLHCVMKSGYRTTRLHNRTGDMAIELKLSRIDLDLEGKQALLIPESSSFLTTEATQNQCGDFDTRSTWNIARSCLVTIFTYCSPHECTRTR
ncbi:hypothetical protein BDZ97DRAFT_1409195 [Flammula alnicola]|nr:hypothetical protein BDZ97DRAFT_1409195 [Flammula alnicola]